MYDLQLSYRRSSQTLNRENFAFLLSRFCGYSRFMRKKLLRLIPLTSLLACMNVLAFATTPPKYGHESRPLAQDHSYFLNHKAPDFWALAPYYVHQQTGSACSIASVTQVVNASRHAMNLDSDTRLATQNSVLEVVGDSRWTAAVGGINFRTIGNWTAILLNRVFHTHFKSFGVTLDELGPLVQKAIRAHGFPEARVEVFHATDLSDATQKELHRALVENEESTRDFIILNFLQGVYTGDSDVGHVSPLAAYDALRRRALVMDVDREWYEPYWVSEAVLLKGMATLDSSSGKNRGWLWVHLGTK